MSDEIKTQSRALRLLGIGGSMRARSLSRRVLQAALRLAEEAGARSVLADVRALDLPLYNADRRLEDYPPTLAWLLHEHPLLPASFSADQHASAAWNLELGCKEVEQRRIRGAFDGWVSDSHSPTRSAADAISHTGPTRYRKPKSTPIGCLARRRFYLEGGLRRP